MGKLKNNRQRRKEWQRRILAQARTKGDRRPAGIILEEASDREKTLDLAFAEAFHDREKAETVSLHTYQDVDIFRGDVLIQRDHFYQHPVLRAS